MDERVLAILVYIPPQLLMNCFLDRILADKAFNVFAKIAFVVHPIVFTCAVVFIGNDMRLNEHNALALDVTAVFSRWHVLMLLIIILVQVLFNLYLRNLLRKAD